MYSPWAVNAPLNNVNSRPSTLNPKPEIPNHKPQTRTTNPMTQAIPALVNLEHPCDTYFKHNDTFYGGDVDRCKVLYEHPKDGGYAARANGFADIIHAGGNHENATK